MGVDDGLFAGIAIGVIFPDAPVWEVFYCSFIETVSKPV